MTIQSKLISMSCTFVIATALAMPVNADSKTQPGYACAPFFNTDSTIFNNLDIVNTSGATTVFECPILREKTGTAPILTVIVKLFNAENTGQNRLCSVVSSRANGTVVQVKQQAYSGFGVRTVTFNNIKTVSRGVVGVGCAVANGSRIRSYFWNE